MNTSEGKKEVIREDLLSVSRENVLEHAEDFEFLRREGILMIERLSGNVWTDYNATDPGITLLEAMCYALTDLGYRTLMEPEDILAEPGGVDRRASESAGGADRGVLGESAGGDGGGLSGATREPLAHEILSSNPLTIADYRKLIIDTEGVKNAYIEPSLDNEVFLYYPGGKELVYTQEENAGRLQLKGIYRVLVEFEYSVARAGRQKEVIADVRRRLQANRGLCEDFAVISEVETELVPLDMKLVVHEGADIERITAEIFHLVENEFSRDIPFYSLWQLQHKGVPTEEIFEGPLLKHGFIDVEDLNASTRLTKTVLSDLINPILAIEGVIAVQRIARRDDEASFAFFGERPGEQEPARKMQKMSRLDLQGSSVVFARSGDRHRQDDRTPDKNRVLALYHFLRSQVKTTKLQRHRNHIEAPAGSFMNIAHYRPFQQDLPACYLDERRLLLEEEPLAVEGGLLAPGGGSRAVEGGPLALEGGPLALEGGRQDSGSRRQMQVLQLKGFLMVFEQLMADYCSRLANMRRIFSGEPITQTHFPERLEMIAGAERIFVDFGQFQKRLMAITEPDDAFLQNRNAILDHLLSRVAERIDADSLYPGSGRASAGHALIHAKERFLMEHTSLSRDRGIGFDYTNKRETWDTTNVSGVKKRICRLLGMEDYKTDLLTRHWITIDKHEHSQGVTREAVVIRDEAGGRELLRSKGYDSDSEVRNILEFILRYGGDRKSYRVDEENGKFFYLLRRWNTEAEEEMVGERHFDDPAERDQHLEDLLALLSGFLRKENFHLVEHLLLRPRLDPQRAHGAAGGQSAGVRLLSPRVVPAVGVRSAAEEEKPAQLYQFKWGRKRIAGNKEIFKLSLVSKTKGEPVIFSVEEDFQYMEDLFERMRLMREAGADAANFDPDKDVEGRTILHLRDGDRVLATGNKTYSKKEDMEKEREELVAFFSYEQTLQNQRNVWDEEQETMTEEADPYSLQVSYFIPTWPLRFSDPSFRHVVEKCIASETPAHVFPRIYWLDYKEMKDLEMAYKPWLENLAAEGIPDIGIVNHLVGVMNHFSAIYPY